MPTICFVGNGVPRTNQSEAIDSADIVIRSQLTLHYDTGLTGRRCDYLVMRQPNRGCRGVGSRIARRVFTDKEGKPRDINRDVASQILELWLVPEMDPEICVGAWFWKYHDYLEEIPIVQLPHAHRRRLCKELAALDTQGRIDLRPTCGSLLLAYLMYSKTWQNHRVVLAGYAWDIADAFHPINAERAWVDQQVVMGRVIYLPV
jgi:hypothetical protein